MANSQGRFVWYELMTTDTEAAKAFYGSVVGWGTQDASMPDMNYTLLTVGATPAAGLMTLPEKARNMGVPPNWLGYVSVDDVDAIADQVNRLGGTVHVSPKDIPEVGRFSVLADPQGAAFAVLKWLRPDQVTPPPPETSGYAGWHELLAVDWQSAFDFYSDLFGWQKADTIDIGELGTYQLFSTGERPLGGMFNKPPTVPVPFWLYYFNVDDINAAAERVRSGGGRIINGPMQVPGGSWIVQCADPQRAMFALVAPRR